MVKIQKFCKNIMMIVLIILLLPCFDAFEQVYNPNNTVENLASDSEEGLTLKLNDDNSQNYLYTIDVTIGGTQTASFLIDLNANKSVVFSSALTYSSDSITLDDTGVNDFYDPDNDKQVTVVQTGSYQQTQLGISFKASEQLSSNFCVQQIESLEDELCILNTFYYVTQITDNNWFNQFDISNIGGILGLGYDIEQEISIWTLDVVAPDQMSINIYPSDEDWSWMADPPIEYEEYQQNTLKFGKGQELGKSDPTNGLVLYSENPLSLTFTLTNLTLNEQSRGEWNLISNLNTEPVTLQLGFNGIGLPSYIYRQAIYYLQNVQPDLVCDETTGAFCYVEAQTCQELENMLGSTTLEFHFMFQPDLTIVLPLSTQFRQTANTDGITYNCQILLINLGKNTDAGVILGGSYMQSFYSLVLYNYLYERPLVYWERHSENIVVEGTLITNDSPTWITEFREVAQYVYYSICMFSILLWAGMTLKDIYQNYEEQQVIKRELEEEKNMAGTNQSQQFEGLERRLSSKPSFSTNQTK